MDSTAKLAEGNTAFALDLYRELRTKDGNLFFSPYSLTAALAMTCAGARGQTEEQMAKALHFELKRSDLHPAFKALQAAILQAQGSENIIKIANAIWPHRRYPFLQEYIDLLLREYGVQVTPVDYVSATEQARLQINAWAEGKTDGLIRNLIGPGVLGPLTVLVLVNAIYFKGVWARPFRPENTAPAPFHTGTGETIEVPMMQLKDEFRYSRNEHAQMLELPYAGETLSMLILLPDRADGLPALEEALSAANLRKWLSARFYRPKVDLSLPRFRLDCGYSFNEPLKRLGMEAGFSAQADFSGMDGSRELSISQVLQRACVDVNEQGTEAAAATAVVMQRLAMPEPPVVFCVDHPFLFLIRERATGSILFMGRVDRP
jgi:serpin B